MSPPHPYHKLILFGQNTNRRATAILFPLLCYHVFVMLVSKFGWEPKLIRSADISVIVCWIVCLAKDRNLISFLGVFKFCLILSDQFSLFPYGKLPGLLQWQHEIQIQVCVAAYWQILRVVCIIGRNSYNFHILFHLSYSYHRFCCCFCLGVSVLSMNSTLLFAAWRVVARLHISIVLIEYPQSQWPYYF